MKMLVVGLAAIALAAVALWLLGPRVIVDTTIRFDPTLIGEDLEAYLQEREAMAANIRPGLEKEIVWARSRKERTPLAIVYVHGFSASKGEVRPLPDQVARQLGANLFFTRLTGHGQDGAALAEATVNDWINDLAEAVAIGRRIGDRVVVMAASTGAGLASWGATQPEFADIAGLVLISPNYSVRAAGAWLLTMPWGGRIARLAVGDERGFQPANQLQAELWTTRYPTVATLPMAALTALARSSEIEKATAPALFVFSDEDRVVDASETRRIAERWGAPHRLVVVTETDDPMHHVIAGDAFSPSTTGYLAATMAEWIEGL